MKITRQNIISFKRIRESVGKLFFSFGYLVLSAIIIFPVLTSCRDNECNDDFGKDEAGKVKVTFSLPSPVINTRDGNAEYEGYMSNLYVAVIDDKDNLNIFELSTTGQNPTIGSKDTEYEINLYPGTYKFYVLANFDRYLTRFSKVSGCANEDDIKNIVLNFNVDTSLVPYHLPMVCLPSEIKTAEYGNPVNYPYYITIDDKNTTHIWAEMKFLCSKVRYTILYNNTTGGCSSDFGNASIRFLVDQTTVAIAKNVRKQTKFDLTRNPSTFDENWFFIRTTQYGSDDVDGSTGATSTAEGFWNLELNRYRFKDGNFDENYPSSYSDDRLTAWDNDPDLSKWKESRQRVWQGIVYLPENLGFNNTTTIAKTELWFPYVMEKYDDGTGKYHEESYKEGNYKKMKLFGENTNEIHYDTSGNQYASSGNNDGYNHGLERGMMYDVVAKVVNPDDMELYVQVKIGVLPWNRHTYPSQTL